MVDERRIYKVGELACKVEVTGHHTCVRVNSTGIWPLSRPTEPVIEVTIGQLVRRKKNA